MKNIKKVDSQLHKIVQSFELLSSISPANFESEKKRFIKRQYKENPCFTYKSLSVNPREIKKSLREIRVESIEDDDVRQMYEETIQSYVVKADMLLHRNTEKFLDLSVKYFGQPKITDTKKSKFLLKCPDFVEEKDEIKYSALDAKEIFEKEGRKFGFDLKVELKKQMVSRALVSNSKQTVYLNRFSEFSEKDVYGLIEHEVGVHLLTSKNARFQSLKIFKIGFPLNTKTQEGLAVASEYWSNNISIRRLKELSLRVIAVNSLLEGNDFQTTFSLLKEQYKVDEDKAFYITTRVFRGGGFTKDYLYIRGLSLILRQAHKGVKFDNLFIGKTSVEYLHTIDKMVEEKLIPEAKYKNDSFQNLLINPKTHPILKYIVEGIVD
ncbi:MAG: flavohemoglobin expression-modulating QEGLA motif protein [Flavobacteriales bacterium]|nr:flavohemoglobin expression-modulating QEGLA motif protein [Flavobacteriales bacterium]